MSSKTFKSVTDNESELDVRANDCGVFIAFSRAGQIRQASTFAPSDAPALALAILDAAGYGEEVVTDGSPDGHIQVAKYYLYEGVKAHASITAEAEAQAKLEAEALELINAYRDSMGYTTCYWETVGESDRKNWLAVARRAREINKEGSNA